MSGNQGPPPLPPRQPGPPDLPPKTLPQEDLVQEWEGGEGYNLADEESNAPRAELNVQEASGRLVKAGDLPRPKQSIVPVLIGGLVAAGVLMVGGLFLLLILWPSTPSEPVLIPPAPGGAMPGVTAGAGTRPIFPKMSLQTITFPR